MLFRSAKIRIPAYGCRMIFVKIVRTVMIVPQSRRKHKIAPGLAHSGGFGEIIAAGLNPLKTLSFCDIIEHAFGGISWSEKEP